MNHKDPVKTVYQVTSDAMKDGVNKGLSDLKEVYNGYIKAGVISAEVDPATFLDTSFQAGIRELTTEYIKEGIADPNRVGVMGWSHGGYISLLSVFREQHPFRAAAAIVPVTKVMADAKEPFDPKAYLPTVTGYYSDVKGNIYIAFAPSLVGDPPLEPQRQDAEHRRRGLLRGLYDFQKKDLAGQFDVGVALVSHSNPHSMQAHVEGLGMSEAGEFEVNGNLFAILAFRI